MSNEPNILAHQSRAHSRISPSGLGTLSVCPHFQNDNAKPEHLFTTQGTMIHGALEHRDLSLLPEDLRPIAQVGLDFWDRLRDQTPGWQEECEPQIQVTEEMQGHLDVLRVGPEAAMVLDFKTGLRKQATAATNIQQKAYALGVFRKYPQVQRISIYLAYLRLDEADTAELTRDQMPELELEVLSILRRAQAAQRGELNARRPDPNACSWCVHAGICPALHAITIPTARAYAASRPEDLVVPEAYDPALITDPNVMAKAMAVADVMERWISSVKKHALDLRFSVGVEIPGTSLVSKAGSKSILDPSAAHRVAEEHGLNHDEFMTAVEVSAAKLLKVAESKAPRGKKKMAAQELEDALRDAGALHIGAETFYLRRVKKAEGEKTVDV